ncbi:MAG: hypothetical protein J6K89_04080 [Oscillospiraceae bacterium]|nr:hypothetical protein [Oscillospiraceae bacterium]
MYWFIGGDQRSFRAAQYLREHGRCVHTYGVPQMKDQSLPQQFSVVILPFPSFRGDRLSGERNVEFSEILPRIGKGSRVYGGLLSGCREAMETRGAQVIDLYDTEPLTTLNAIPTVEGALALAIESSPITIHGANCLVIGAGRIGTLLARRLQAMGAQVTVAARSVGDRERIRAMGLEAEESGSYHKGLGQYEFLFNTVPARILNREQLSQLGKDGVLMELASAPGGFSPQDCEALGLHGVYAPGLPGRFSPKTAGILYARSILEREETL